MAKKKTPIVEDQASDNAATVANKPNKANAMATAVTLLASMSGDEINQLLATLQQNSASAAASIPNDAAAKNAASIAMKEELETIFGGEESLAEEFKEKITTLFEAAVNTRVQLTLTEMEEKFNAQLDEQVAAVTDQLTEQVDKYLSYVADEWMKENEVAIESSLRTEMAEQFIDGLKNLFKEHYIEVPEDRIDVLEAFETELEEVKGQLNEAITRNIELEEIVAQTMMEEAFDEASSGLAMTQVEKFRTLAEGIEFDGDIETYSRKLNIIKEKHFAKKSAAINEQASVLSEGFDGDVGSEEEQVAASPVMKRYLETISRTVKK